MTASQTSAITEISAERFVPEVLEAAGPVLVEFYAPWCGNCRRLAPVLDRLAVETANRVRIIKVDAERAPELARRYEVTGTPTLIRFEAGTPVASLVGVQSEQAVRDLLAERADADRPGLRRLLAWVPADACSLPNEGQAARLVAFEDLFAASVQSVERAAPTRLRLALVPDPAVAARAAELAVRESDCCGFFSFNLAAAEGTLALEVTVPENRVTVLDGLAAQAATAGTPA